MEKYDSASKSNQADGTDSEKRDDRIRMSELIENLWNNLAARVLLNNTEELKGATLEPEEGMKDHDSVDESNQEDGTDSEKSLLDYMPVTQTDLRLSDLVNVVNMIDKIYGKDLSQEDWRRVYERIEEQLGPDFKEKIVDILVYAGLYLLGPMALPRDAVPAISADDN